MEYAIRLDDGTLIRDSGWNCPGDVMKGYVAFGVRRVYGSLVRRSEPAGDWEVVYPSPTEAMSNTPQPATPTG